MPGTVVALVTGFTKIAGLADRSFAPLRRLKAASVINRILYVTWDEPSLDPLLSFAAAMPDVEMVRVPQPQITGQFYEKSFIYQRRNFVAALDMVADPDALVLKTRPDFIFDDAFLAGKIQNFERTCAPSDLASRLGISMPPSPFRAKIWVPWADAAQPFFFEDGVFMGLRSDLAQLQPEETEQLITASGDIDTDWSIHMLRYIAPFLDDYPILRKYLAELRYFVKDTDYRVATLPTMLNEPYFWCLLVISAWVLVTNFHIDCGTDGQMGIYSNRQIARLSDTSLENLTPSAPYDNVELWRSGQFPGGVTPCVQRKYGRLMDDSWQTALFTEPVLRDLTRDNLFVILGMVHDYKNGVLTEMEDAFYATMRTLYEKHWQKRAA